MNTKRLIRTLALLAIGILTVNSAQAFIVYGGGYPYYGYGPGYYRYGYGPGFYGAGFGFGAPFFGFGLGFGGGWGRRHHRY